MNTRNINAVNAAKRKYAGQLKSLPHVKGVGVGTKVTAGRATDQLAVKVYVDKKVALEDLAESERIPGELDGIPTDVEVIGELRARPA